MNRTHQLSLPMEQNCSGQQRRLLYAGGLMSSLKVCMQQSLAATYPPISRDQLVDKMNAVAKQYGWKITTGSSRILTINILEKWLNPNANDEPPLKALEVFMLALNDFSPLKVLAEVNGCKLISEEEIPFFEYGKEKFEAKQRSRKIKQLEGELDSLQKVPGGSL